MESFSSFVSELQEAIKSGKKAEAKRLAEELATRDFSVRVKLDENVEQQNVTINIENKLSAGIRLTLSMSSHKNIRFLKKQIRELFGFPLENQIYFLNTTPIADELTIRQVTASPDQTQLYMYLLDGCRKKKVEEQGVDVQ